MLIPRSSKRYHKACSGGFYLQEFVDSFGEAKIKFCVHYFKSVVLLVVILPVTTFFLSVASERISAVHINLDTKIPKRAKVTPKWMHSNNNK